jgi:hypothetical protein
MPLKGPFILIWIIFCCSYGIFWLRRYFLDKKDAFEKYIVGDLTSNGFTLVSSKFINNKTPIPIQNYKSALHPASGGLTMVTLHGYKVFRTVIIKDRLGRQLEVLAAIEFDDRSLLRKFKGVHWTPELNTFLQVKED